MMQYKNAIEFFENVLRPHLGFLITENQFQLKASNLPPIHFEEFIWLYRNDVALILCVVSWQVIGISIGRYSNGMAMPLMLLDKLIWKRKVECDSLDLAELASTLRDHFPDILAGEVPVECLVDKRESGGANCSKR